MTTTESDIRCYELIAKYFEYNDPLQVQEMRSRLGLEEEWESLPEEFQQRILAVDQDVQARYSRWYEYGIFNQYMATIQARMRKAGLELPSPNNDLVERIKTPYTYYSRDARNPKFTKKQIEYFQMRTKVYLDIWENADKADLLKYDWEDRRSPASARAALQRVFWGNHLQDGQIFRLANTDLKWLRDPAYPQIHSGYKKDIKELLEFYELYYMHLEQNKYEAHDFEHTSQAISYDLDQWDWVTHNWQDEDANEEQLERSLQSRWRLHCIYQNGCLPSEDITTLIALDKAAMLSEVYRLFSPCERKFVHAVLLDQGVFDKMPE
ncbi:MAG: hypothetical protein RBR69_09970 [Candidatus Cloacimonadaceae bacterium]|nr:hypothetical protein [Candidatus Cloacimonadota bacterium]MDY0128445.1 hypothetical protein [Candidatus Cloacimonadaceae bacterium]